jgi:hypothetical protein
VTRRARQPAAISANLQTARTHATAEGADDAVPLRRRAAMSLLAGRLRSLASAKHGGFPLFVGRQFCRASYGIRGLYNLLTIEWYFNMPICTARCARKVTRLMRHASA